MKNFIKILYSIRYFLYLINLLAVLAVVYYGYQIFVGAETNLWILLYLTALTIILIYTSHTIRTLGRLMFVNNTFITEEVTPELVTLHSSQEDEEDLPIIEDVLILDEAKLREIFEKDQETTDFEVDYDKMKVAELREIAKERNISKYSAMKKAELIEALQQTE